MVKQIFAALFVLILAVSFSTVTFAQEQTKTDAQKVDKKEIKTDKVASRLKSVTCPPDCGFMCRSHDEKELTTIVKAHAKKAHNMSYSDKEIKGMMKIEDTAGSYK